MDSKYVIDSGKEVINRCPHEGMRVNIELNGDAVLKLRYLQDKFKDVEFLVYGNARKLENNSYILEDIVVPEQVVGVASVDDIKPEGNYNLVIHKHPGGATGFSATDEQFVNSNHDFSIVIGDDTKLKNINGIASIQIECGRYMKAKLDIDVVIPKSKDLEFIKSTDKIKMLVSSIDSSFFSIFKSKKPNLCSKCKEPLEKIEKTDDATNKTSNEWHCNRCGVTYVSK